MNWFRENRFLGTFLILFAICTLSALNFLFNAKSNFDKASAQFNDVTAERNRLEHLDPFPNEANYRKIMDHLENYGAALKKLKDELKTQVLPVFPLAPNEFQSRLRQTMVATADKARANRVKLPDNFRLGFDEFTAALPNTDAAPFLGQELTQIELLMNILIDLRVDSVTAFKRMSSVLNAFGTATTTAAVVARKPAAAASSSKILERGIVDLAFMSSPSAARKVLNEIASSNQQFFIIRTLNVRNEQEKGPPRETAEATASTGAIKFIVGNEHIETSAMIEMVRFAF